MENTFTKNFIKTDWILQIENIITTAFKVAEVITQKQANVLVYCPMGNSGSSLLTCLTQIICDPFYRTFEGLKTLVHKEWLYYRHDFLKKGLILVDNN